MARTEHGTIARYIISVLRPVYLHVYLLVSCSMPSWPSHWGYLVEGRRKQPLLHKVAPAGHQPPTRRRMSMRGVCVSLRPSFVSTRRIATPSVHDLTSSKNRWSPGSEILTVQKRKKPKLSRVTAAFYFEFDWVVMKLLQCSIMYESLLYVHPLVVSCLCAAVNSAGRFWSLAIAVCIWNQK